MCKGILLTDWVEKLLAVAFMAAVSPALPEEKFIRVLASRFLTWHTTSPGEELEGRKEDEHWRKCKRCFVKYEISIVKKEKAHITDEQECSRTSKRAGEFYVMRQIENTNY